MKAPRALPIALGLLGLGLLIPAVYLIALGGSFYYLIAALALLASAVLLWRGDPRGAWVYGAMLAYTYLWSFYETGLDAWALAARVGLFTALGLWFLLPRLRRQLAGGAEPRPLLRQRGGQVALMAAAALIVALSVTNGRYHVAEPSQPGTGMARNASGDWSHYGATPRGTRYAPHGQIDLGNVWQLERAWVARTGVPGTFKGTPLQIDDGVYLCTGQNVILALDGDSGAERWRYDPRVDAPPIGFWDTCRGVSWHRAPAGSVLGDCRERIFTATTDSRLIAVDKDTGRPCGGFGDRGEVDLLAGMGEVPPGYYFVTSPPTVARDVVVVGGWVLDNREVGEPSGVVRGFSALTGELLWAWDIGRQGGSPLPPEGESYTRGTPNVWSIASADEELGLIYLPTGNATPDYFSVHRSPVMEEYSSSVVALEIATGRVRWHFQTTRHDIWDYDVPSQPTLVDIPVDGVMRRAVAVLTKRAEVFLLDRVTGEPIAEVAELPVPQTDVPGETTVPTQPFSVGMPSFADRILTEADMWGITPFDQIACRIQFRRLRYEGPLTPPSLQGTLFYPGVAGGMNWGSGAVDEVNHLLVVNVLHMPSVVHLIPREDLAEVRAWGVGGLQQGLPYAVTSLFFFSPLFTPCLRPPYGEMAVIDLAARELLWRRPVGSARGQGPLGIPSRLPLPMGMFFSGGTAVTAGGLIFFSSTADSTVRALNLFNGKVVWTDRLPASSTATPMSYVSPRSGKQYVVVTVPEGRAERQSETGENAVVDSGSEGGYVIAYALPD